MSVPWPFAALIGLLGLLVGSFLNVVIYRVPRGESILFPASHCPACDEELKPRHNVPVVSWVVLRARCAYCSVPISARYPLVEAGTAAIYTGMTVQFGISLELPVFLYLGTVGLALALIGMDGQRLPDAIVLPSYAVCLLLMLPAGVTQHDYWRTERSLVGMALIIGVFFALWLAYPNGLSLADLKLAGLLGLGLGWLSWGALAISVVTGLLIATAVGTGTALARRPTRNLAVPLCPCLVSSTILTIFIAAPVTALCGAWAST